MAMNKEKVKRYRYLHKQWMQLFCAALSGCSARSGEDPLIIAQRAAEIADDAANLAVEYADKLWRDFEEQP